MSAFGGKADIERIWSECPLLTQSGRSNLLGLFARNGWGDLGNKAGSALEGYVTPQPGYGDNETILDANEKINVHGAPEHPANKTLQLDTTNFYHGGVPADGRQDSLIPITKWWQ